MMYCSGTAEPDMERRAKRLTCLAGSGWRLLGHSFAERCCGHASGSCCLEHHDWYQCLSCHIKKTFQKLTYFALVGVVRQMQEISDQNSPYFPPVFHPLHEDSNDP